MDNVCEKYITMIDYLGEGAFGKVYKVYDIKLKRRVALKISHHIGEDGIEEEIQIIRRLKELQVPNVTEFLGEGRCELLENKRYYLMSLEDQKIKNLLDNHRTYGTSLKQKEFFGIFFELIVTLAIFRHVKFKHRDISEWNILYRINEESRIYAISDEFVTISTMFQPIISDFNTSTFAEIDLSDPNEMNDTIAILNVMTKLYEITNLTETGIISTTDIFDMFQEDNLTPVFLVDVLLKLKHAYENS